MGNLVRDENNEQTRARVRALRGSLTLDVLMWLRDAFREYGDDILSIFSTDGLDIGGGTRVSIPILSPSPTGRGNAPVVGRLPTPPPLESGATIEPAGPNNNFTSSAPAASIALPSSQSTLTRIAQRVVDTPSLRSLLVQGATGLAGRMIRGVANPTSVVVDAVNAVTSGVSTIGNLVGTLRDVLPSLDSVRGMLPDFSKESGPLLALMAGANATHDRDVMVRVANAIASRPAKSYIAAAISDRPSLFSYLPLPKIRNDGEENLAFWLLAAACYEGPEAIAALMKADLTQGRGQQNVAPPSDAELAAFTAAVAAAAFSDNDR